MENLKNIENTDNTDNINYSSLYNNKVFENFIRECQGIDNEIDYFYILDHLENSQIKVKEINSIFRERFNGYEESFLKIKETTEKANQTLNNKNK